MQTIEMTAKPRTVSGKGAAHKLRARGEIPAVLYGGGREALALQLDSRAFTRLVDKGVSGHLVRITVEGESGAKQHAALVKSVQVEPVKGSVLHVDFHEVALDQAIETTIPISFVGEDARIKDGGVLQHLAREVTITCLPTAIPDAIELDVSGLNVGEALHLGDLQLPDGVTLAGGDPEDVVVSVAAPRVEAAPATTAEEAAEGEAAAEAEAPEDGAE